MPTGAKLDTTLPMSTFPSMDAAIEFAQDAEDVGYSFISMSEVTGYNAVAVQGALARQTTEIGITNDVISPYGRSPALLGQTAATVQQLSGGRYRMGLGASSPPLAEQWHGREFDRPLRTLREAIEIINMILAGERADYSGEIFDLGGLNPEFDAIEPKPGIDIAALGPKSVEMTGRFADGWVPQLFTPDGLRDRLEDLERGAELGDRSLDDLRVTPTFRCCALEDRERARTLARDQLVFMLAAYGPFYRESVARQGWEEVTSEIHQRWEDGDKEGARDALPDELMDDLVGAGRPEEVRERIRKFTDIDAVDAVRISFSHGQSVEELEQTRDALAPENW
ncbi:TIGR04024 family LLM class F420-dependent oxidoreductase [Halorientalis salina]|uniref:TIGR04024 family LLM class F420-dependent oxidoreductase n=1 Tax=Halorientalis salina TaxID=2932266 RepID=UPI0010ABEA0D|nr:TIGR04024 family LLM class F420-dependent oxidoreductase [Halorientalis salina]